MADESAQSAGLRDRIARQGEDALGKLAQELLENPLVNSSIAKAFEARERAVQAQETAMGALNIPSAADIERLTRRLRSVSQRMEGIEEAVDRLDQRLAGIANAQAANAGPDDQLAALEGRLSTLTTEISNLASALDASPTPLPREQERLKVDEPAPTTPARKRTAKKKT
jgi:predicted  nucleic acid-binding Zn-ribbon protein